MRFKNDSINPDICAPLLLGLLIADDVYREHGAEMVITSLKDGAHSHTSLHYAGAAADLRIRNLESAPKDVAKAIRKRLNRHFDVILESDHIHLEWQPRRP